MTELQNSKEHDLQSLDHDISTSSPRGSTGSRIPEVLLEGDLIQDLGGEDLVPSSRVAVAVDPVALITTECITVTSAMRKHARWAHSSASAILGGSSISYRATALGASSKKALRAPIKVPLNVTPREKQTLTPNDEDSVTGRWGLRGKKGKSMQDNPLMSAFARLRCELRGCQGSVQMIRVF